MEGVSVMKVFTLAIAFFVLLAGCASPSTPPKPANEMWKPTREARAEVSAALRQCNFIDRMSAGVAKIHEQARCMRDHGFEPDLSSYSPHNCYGDAPAGCIVYW